MEAENSINKMESTLTFLEVIVTSLRFHDDIIYEKEREISYVSSTYAHRALQKGTMRAMLPTDHIWSCCSFYFTYFAAEHSKIIHLGIRASRVKMTSFWLRQLSLTPKSTMKSRKIMVILLMGRAQDC